MPNLMFLVPAVPEIYGGGPKISKVGYVTPFRPINGGWLVTRYLDSLPNLPIHYTTFIGLRLRVG